MTNTKHTKSAVAGCKSSGPRLGKPQTPLLAFQRLGELCRMANVPYMVKQADVCELCEGLGSDRTGYRWRCGACQGSGQAGKLVTGCPPIFGVRYDGVAEVLR